MCAISSTGKAVSADDVCNPNINVAQIGAVTRWTPSRTSRSREVHGFVLDQKFQDSAALTPSATAPGVAQGVRYEFKEQSTMSFDIRAQFNF